MLELFFIDVPVKEAEVTEPVKYLSVTIRHKDGTVETENFQNLSVLEMIADEIEVLFWKHKDLDGEVFSEGTSMDSLKKYFN